MRIPFERLVEMVEDLSEADKQLPMGDLAKRWNVSVERIMDACDASKMLRGLRTYYKVIDPKDYPNLSKVMDP